jgi:hypothetical protein
MDAGTATSLFSELGYVIPTGITGALVVCFVLYIRWQEAKQDKDRTEHIAKWDSIITLYKETTQKMTATWDKEMVARLEAHEREMERQFKLYERTASALESLTHNLTMFIKGREI